MSEVDDLREILILQGQAIQGLSDRIDVLVVGNTALETLFALSLTALETREPHRITSTLEKQIGDIDAPHRIEFNDGLLRALERIINNEQRKGSTERVLTIAEAAAHWACFHHPGRFASATIERALAATGRVLQARSPTWIPPGGGPHVLHIATTVYPIGGHTRLLERWISRDRGKQHTVVITDQGDNPIPPALLEVTNNRVLRLSAATRTERVSELASLFHNYDRIMLHIHPYDSVAVAACADPTHRPPSIFVDHGDHLFWLGLSGADTLLALRPSGAQLGMDRRGFPEERVRIIPLPIDPITPSITRDDARKRFLGNDPGVIIATMGSDIKYSPVGELNFPHLITDVLTRVPDATFIGIGPEAGTNKWQTLLHRFGSRVFLLGPQEAPDDLLVGVDLYVDSFPFSSPTAILEASNLGIPSISLQLDGYGPMFADFPVVTPQIYRTPEAWVTGVVRLLDDQSLRSQIAVRMRHEVAASHLQIPWLETLSTLESSLPIGSWDLPQVDAPVEMNPIDLLLASYQRANGAGKNAAATLTDYGLLPPGVAS